MFARLLSCCCPDMNDEDPYQPSQSLLSAQQMGPAEAQGGAPAAAVSMMSTNRSLQPAENEENAEARAAAVAACVAATVPAMASASSQAGSGGGGGGGGGGGSGGSGGSGGGVARSDPVPIAPRPSSAASGSAEGKRSSVTASLDTSAASPTIGSLEMYNAMLGLSGPLDADDEGKDGPYSALNTETCSICCSEIILGPQEAVSKMSIPPGEKPRHFECGHALHADCYAVYICSSRSGHACPICAIERSDVTPLSASYLAQLEAEEAEEEEAAARFMEARSQQAAAEQVVLEARGWDGERGRVRGRGGRDAAGGGGGEHDVDLIGGFSAGAVLQALSLAGAGRQSSGGEEEEGEGGGVPLEDMDDDEAAEAAREELELQAALQMSVRRES